MFKKFLEGIFIGIGIFISISILLAVAFSSGFHSANEIIGGVFTGNYSFNGNLNFTNATT